jgi:hypothetical protein
VLGVAAFVAALALAAGQPAATGPATALSVLAAPHVRVLVLPAAERARVKSCAAQRSQSNGVERNVLPVACEQPPRSSVNVPNGATGGLSPLLGR